MSYQIQVSKTEEISQTIKKTGLEVKKDDKIDFIISAGKNSGWDYGKLEMKIKDADSTPTPTSGPSGDGDSSGNGGDDPQEGDEENEGRTNEADLAADFSGTQGQKGWQYGVCKWDGKDFEKLSDFVDAEKYVSNDGVELKKDYVHPGPEGNRTAAYRWIVAQDGKINIKVTYEKYPNSEDSNADGVSLRVWHNGTEKKFENSGISGTDITESKVVTIELNNLEVKANDDITFGVNPEGNNSYDGGKMKVEITPAEES